MVFDSVVRHWRESEHCMASQEKPHIIISNLEHDSVAKCVERLRGDGLAGTRHTHIALSIL